MSDPKPLPHPDVRYMFDASGKPTQQAYEFLERLVKVAKDANEAIAAAQAAITALGTPAQNNLAFVTIGNTGSLSAERAITAGAEISVTDGGANAGVTIAYNGSRGGNIVGAQGVGAGTTYVRSSLPAHKLLLVFLNGLSHSAGINEQLQIEVSSNNGTNWSTPVILSTSAFAAGLACSGMCAISTDGSATAYVDGGFISTNVGGAVTIGGGGSAINAIRLSWTPAGASFDAGTVNIVAIN